MNLPWAVWGTLICGVALIVLARARHVRVAGLLSALLVWTSLGVTINPGWGWSALSLDHLARAGIGLAILWSVGFGAGLTSSTTPFAARWGWMWLIVAGLCAVTCGQDWLTIGLAWEIVRRATAALCESSACDRMETSDVFRDFGSLGRVRDALWPSLGFWTSVVAWLFCTGTLELSEIATALQRSYAARAPEVSLGRPALIVQAAACLVVISTLAPCFTIVWRIDRSETDDAKVAALCARQLAAMLLLTRCGRDVFFGLEASLGGIVLVFAGAAYLAAARLTSRPSRLDQLWIGCGLWQLAVSLNWLLMVLLTRTSIGGGLPTANGSPIAAWGLLFELLHTVVVLAGASAAVRLASRGGTPPAFLEELRGRARSHPAWALLVLVPIASLIGLPGLWGGWLYFFRGVALWSLPQAGPNDTLTPHGGLIALQLVGLAAWVLMGSAMLNVFRTLLWDQPWTTWTSRGDAWNRVIAISTAALLLIGGLAPHIWLQRLALP